MTPRWPRVAALLLALGAAVLEPAPAGAWTELLEMNVVPEQSGWSPVFDGSAGSMSVVKGGILTLTSKSYREYRAPGSWLDTVDPAAGYVIEFRMRILIDIQCVEGDEIGVWYHDQTNVTVLSIGAGRIGVRYPTNLYASVDAKAWRTYTIVVQGSHHRVFVDGVLTLDYLHPGTGAGAKALLFGDLGPCGYTQSEWDYVAYDTAPRLVSTAPTTWGRLKALYRSER